MTSLLPITIATLGVGTLIGLVVYFNTTPEKVVDESISTPVPSAIVLDSQDTEAIEATPEETSDLVQNNAIVSTPTPRPATPTPRPTKLPTPEPQQPLEDSSSSASISFIETPYNVRAGEKFAIRVRINGSSDMRGTNASLTVSQEGSSSSGGSSSSVSNNTKQSFGSFRGPTTFESTYSFATTPNAPLNVVATAEVDGKTITATRTITIQ